MISENRIHNFFKFSNFIKFLLFPKNSKIFGFNKKIL